MKFCFWGDIGDAIRGTTIGGGELQMALLARSLASEGHEVVVIDPYIDEPFVTAEGISVLNVPGWNKGWPVLRMFCYRIPSLYKLFVKQKADFYYVRMRSFLNILAYAAARKVKARFLLALASDIDLLGFRDKYRYQYKDNFTIRRYLTQWLPGDLAFRYLLKRADYIIRQHEGQKIIDGSVRGKVILFPNIVDLKNIPSNGENKGEHYIYVGSLTMMKGADKLYELANSIDKSKKITVVGQPNDDKAVDIFEKLSKLPSTDLKGRVNHFDTLWQMTKAKALINTSHFEGFPNVFLEAWAIGIPVLSLKVNPGNVISKYGLGICFDGDLERMKEFIASGNKPAADKERMRSYVINHHDFSTAGKRFVNALTKLKIFLFNISETAYENLFLG